MSYLDLIIQFWKMDMEYSFNANEVNIYFRLLDRCNTLTWKNPFNFSSEELMMKCRIKTNEPFDTARNRLKQVGLIDFKKGNGRGQTTIYEIKGMAKEAKKGMEKQHPLADPYPDPLADPFTPSDPLTTIDIDKELEKKKDAAKKAAPPKSVYQQFIDQYFAFHKELAGVEPYFNGVDGKAMKELVKHLKKISKTKSDEGALASWKFILANWDKNENFIYEQVKPAQILNNISKIVIATKKAEAQ